MYIQKITMLLIGFVFIGCTSIPIEAPQLSTQLGKKISSTEDSNIKLLNKFFEQKRNQIDIFINEEWTPIFAEKIFSNKKVTEVWNIIVNENNKEDRLTFLIKVGPKLQKKINEKRFELINPINKLERKIEKEIRTNYTQMRAINNSITSLLLSSSEVSKNRDRYLDMVGVTNKKIDQTIDQTDDLVSSLVRKTNGIPQKVEKAKAFITKIKSLRDSI